MQATHTEAAAAHEAAGHAHTRAQAHTADTADTEGAAYDAAAEAALEASLVASETTEDANGTAEEDSHALARPGQRQAERALLAAHEDRHEAAARAHHAAAKAHRAAAIVA